MAGSVVSACTTNPCGEEVILVFAASTTPANPLARDSVKRARAVCAGDAAGGPETTVSLDESQPAQQAIRRTASQRSILEPARKRNLEAIKKFSGTEVGQSVLQPVLQPVLSSAQPEPEQLKLEARSYRVLIKHTHRVQGKLLEIHAAQLIGFRQDVVRDSNNMAPAIRRLKDIQHFTHAGPE